MTVNHSSAIAASEGGGADSGQAGRGESESKNPNNDEGRGEEGKKNEWEVRGQQEGKEMDAALVLGVSVGSRGLSRCHGVVAYRYLSVSSRGWAGTRDGRRAAEFTGGRSSCRFLLAGKVCPGVFSPW